MGIRYAVVLTLACAVGSIQAAERSVAVYQDDVFAASAQINGCANGCANQMAVNASYHFIFNGNYNDLYNELINLGLRTVAYDSNWQDAESGELLFKVSSTIHQRQRWRRANLRRKVESPIELANAIYSTVPAGQLVTLEFQQAATAVSGSDFTVNVRRYQNDTVVSSGSKAIAPHTWNDNGSTTIEP